MVKKEVNLSTIGMKKGKQYETIVSTNNSQGMKNASPIGILCSGNDKVICRIFKGGKTLDNILSQKEFIVNITHDPELFMLSTIGNLPLDYFDENGSIKGVDAYFKCEVISFKEAVKQSDPIRNKNEAIVIKSEVKELIINNDVEAFNRGFGYVVETLANFTRFDLVDDNQKEEYLNKFREANRVVRKIGYPEDIQAMNEIKKELMKKGFKP